VRIGDLVSRLGGDEFTLIIEDSHPDQLESLAQKTIRTIEVPYKLAGDQEARISASIGIACYPHCASDRTGLIKKADQAMYEVKKQGKNGYGFA
jgi:diguanylate cyclase (GGDEF)-like protein